MIIARRDFLTKQRVYESVIPFEAILVQTRELPETSEKLPEAKIESPLLAETRPAW